MDRKTRKIMIVNRCLHPRRSVTRFYMKQKESGTGFISVKDCMTTREKVRKIISAYYAEWSTN